MFCNSLYLYLRDIYEPFGCKCNANGNRNSLHSTVSGNKFEYMGIQFPV